VEIQVWVVTPFKKPECDLPNNEFFNNHVSILHIHSEHAIGFLKGWFHSLKNLCLDIRDEKTHKVATYWVVACIGIHSFAMQCEAEEQASNEDSEEVIDFENLFIAEGLPSDLSESEINTLPVSESRGSAGQAGLLVAKVHREALKHRHFRAKEACRRQRRHDCAAMI
jgi:hypothetical protein